MALAHIFSLLVRRKACAALVRLITSPLLLAIGILPQRGDIDRVTRFTIFACTTRAGQFVGYDHV